MQLLFPTRPTMLDALSKVECRPSLVIDREPVIRP